MLHILNLEHGIKNINKIHQKLTNVEISSLFVCPNVYYVPVQKLVMIGTFKPPVAKDQSKKYSMHSENFKADFLKMVSAIPASFKNTSHPHFFGAEMWFKYQNNKQNLQIWDMQISQIAKF